jgi:ferredoxin hydrogenase
MAAWRCTVCGYVHQGEKPPQNCPLCKVPASKFVKLEDPKPAKENAEKNGFMDKLKNLFK